MLMSAFLLRFKANYLEKMRGYPHFSLSITVALAKISLFSRGSNLKQKPLYLVGTVLNCNVCNEQKCTAVHSVRRAYTEKCPLSILTGVRLSLCERKYLSLLIGHRSVCNMFVSCLCAC